jgi:hypothetical protein
MLIQVANLIFGELLPNHLWNKAVIDPPSAIQISDLRDVFSYHELGFVWGLWLARNTVKRGRKRKITVLEAEPEPEEPEEPEPEPNATMARMSKAPAPSRASMMETPIVEDEIVPEPWRAPVAKHLLAVPF